MPSTKNMDELRIHYHDYMENDGNYPAVDPAVDLTPTGIFYS